MSMNRRTALLVALVAVLTSASWLPCLAGTTGGVGGVVVDAASRAPLAGVRVAIVSPSQTASATTDAQGHFIFLTLSPDSYTLSAEHDGYDAYTQAGITVQADQTETLPPIALRKALQTIGRVRARDASDLVRPGSTIDTYSVSPVQAQAAAPLGGGASINSLYSALATAPGLFVPPEQQGPNQSVFIRGGYYDQVGYEYDGIPINRSFDNYPGGSQSNLGQQELQVYTGGGTADASATGLSGFINQVIASGTYPGSASLVGGIGGPTFYHQLQFEVGGATESRNFRYYIGLSGYNQDFRYLDQFNGAGHANTFPYATGPSNQTTFLDFYPAVYPTCIGFGGVQDPFDLKPGEPGYIPQPKGQAFDPGCFSAISPSYDFLSTIRDREGVVNLHFGLPHKHNGLSDEIQLLYSSQGVQRQFYSSIDDAGPDTIKALDGTPTWPDYLTFPQGTYFGEPAAKAQVVPYLYPFGPHSYLAPFPADYRGTRWDDAGIIKAQYTKSLSANAYLRLYGYTFYSDSLRGDPTGRALGSGFGATNYDYEVSSHTRGVALQFGDQVSAKHQLSGDLKLMTATTVRYNNNNYYNTSSQPVSNLTDGVDCFAFKSGQSQSGETFQAGQRAPCNDPITQGTFQYPVPVIAYSTSGSGSSSSSGAGTCIASSSGSYSNIGVPCPIVGAAARAGATYRITYTGQQGFQNTVAPTFTDASLSDQFHPNDRLSINAGVRFENELFDLASTQNPGTNFWFTAGQHEFCYNPLTLAPALVPVPPQLLALAPPFIGFDCPKQGNVQTVHPDGLNGHLLLSNTYGPTENLQYILPRVGATYTIDADTVLRASAGRYAQGPQNYQIQYGAKQENLAYPVFQGFWQYGFTTPRHDVDPQYSNDYDFSYERHLKGTDMQLTVTPYYRYATNQLYGVSGAGLSSALNTGISTNYGVEMQFTKGNFSRNGLSAEFSYTYLWSQERYANYPGTSINPVDYYNQEIQEFNALTQAGGGARCYAPFFSSSSSGGGPAPCAGGAIMNPYFHMAPQPLFDRNGSYQTGLDFPWNVPHAFALIVNYRHDKLAITPALTLNAGTWYGNPGDVIGIDPRTCSANSRALTGSPIVKVNPLQADYTSCAFAATPSGNLYIPNPQTGHFDAFGEFQQPWQLNMGLSITYDVSKKVKANLIMANVFNQCFGGSNEPWSRANPPNGVTCGYLSNLFYVSNFYNGVSPHDVGANGVPLNPYFEQSFIPAWADQTSFGYVMPFNAYLTFSIKL